MGDAGRNQAATTEGRSRYHFTDSDVPGAILKEHPGNAFYCKTVTKHSKDIGKISLNVLIQRVIDDVHNGLPRDGFLRLNTDQFWVMSPDQIFLKVRIHKFMMHEANATDGIKHMTPSALRDLTSSPDQKTAAQGKKKQKHERIEGYANGANE